MALNPPVNPKSNYPIIIYSFIVFFSAKIRRLYDIANILSSLGLIKKKVFIGPHHVKKPGYAWSGPSLKDIESIGKIYLLMADGCILYYSCGKEK